MTPSPNEYKNMRDGYCLTASHERASLATEQAGAAIALAGLAPSPFLEAVVARGLGTCAGLRGLAHLCRITDRDAKNPGAAQLSPGRTCRVGGWRAGAAVRADGVV